MPVHVLEDLKLLNLELLKYQFLLNSSQQRSVHLSVYVQIVNILGFANHRVSITIQLAPPMQENSHTWYVNECHDSALVKLCLLKQFEEKAVVCQFLINFKSTTSKIPPKNFQWACLMKLTS